MRTNVTRQFRFGERNVPVPNPLCVYSRGILLAVETR